MAIAYLIGVYFGNSLPVIGIGISPAVGRLAVSPSRAAAARRRRLRGGGYAVARSGGPAGEIDELEMRLAALWAHL
jgi:hypothetical protein